MKNKGMLVIIISTIIFVIVSIFYVLSLKNFDKNLLNHKWYHYNKKNGYTEILYINDEEIIYYKPNNDNQTNDYSFCSDYKYNKATRTILFDCGKKIVIDNVGSYKLDVEIDNEEITFFKNAKYSREYEFNKYFNMTIDEYKNKRKQTLDIIKIDNDKLIEVINDSEYSKIIFLGENCKNIECALIYDIIEKWISYSKNVYYVDSSTLNTETLSELNSINNEFSLDNKIYDDIYPSVYVVSNNKIIDNYKISCEGFSCSQYYNK